MDVLGRVGVSFAIDDFGKGFSSLTHLRHLPLAKLKIDRVFTRHVPENSLDTKLVGAVVALAQSLGMQTVAEGMQTHRQCEFFKELRCDLVQGYLFGAPKSADEMGGSFERSVSCLFSS
jgi:EAL domain-containing protein (putative c-di-GMP-specific phosphodiesterase class I)